MERTQDKPDLQVMGTTGICKGPWTALELKPAEDAVASARWPPGGALQLDTSAVTAMDTAGAWLLLRTVRTLREAGREVTVMGMEPSRQALLDLVAAHAAMPAALPAVAAAGTLERLGRGAERHYRQLMEFLNFAGETAVVARPLLFRPLRIRWSAVVSEMADAGYRALGIVGLLTFLIGVVIAYQGGMQLRQYGASVYTADLVGLTVLRELAPLITAIIVAGRTGSAYTAQIGTMQITEEVDALRTLGVTPVEMLVLPKILALVIVLPLLTVYADFVGLLGGMVMANAQLGISFGVFFDRISESVSLISYLIGIGKAPVFAAIIAAVGCYQGFQVSGSAESVGRQTTLSVVQSIFLVIIADAVFSIAFSNLGI